MSTGLAKVDIQINPNRLGSTLQTADGIAAMVVTGGSVAGKIQVGVPTLLISLADAVTKGITETGINSYAYKHVKEFYAEAGDGAKLTIMVVADAVTMAQMVDKDEPYAKKVIDEATEPIKLIAVSRKSATGVTLANGVDEDVDNAIVKAQELVAALLPAYKECSIVVDAKDWNGEHSDLKDYNTTTDAPYVTPVIGSTDGSKNAAVGLFLGRLAKDPVQRNPARVRSGRLAIESASFTNGEAISSVVDFWDAIHNKGYAFIRTFAGKAGYFFSDAPTCAKATSDLNSVPQVRVITKARALAYQVFLDEILEEIPVDADGKIAPALVKAWQARIESVIDTEMTTKEEISGVRAFIDADQDIIGTSTVNGTLSIQPVGYSRYINIDLGFTKSLT